MPDSPLRRLTSVCLLGAMMLGAWLYYRQGWQSPSRIGTGQRPPGEPSGFHSVERVTLPVRQGPAYCASCHGAAPHWRDFATRAFLNLHQENLDCGICHLTGSGLQPRRFRGEDAVTGETLAQAPGGRLYQAQQQGERWVRILAPSEGFALRKTGPPCAECHRRGSQLLQAEGLYDPYRRRVLEDLAVLRWLRGAAR